MQQAFKVLEIINETAQVCTISSQEQSKEIKYWVTYLRCPFANALAT